MTDHAPEFFSAEWAENVRAAVEAGPGEDVRATKLDSYWRWISRVRASYSSSWALGVRDLPGGGASYLKLTWKEGTCAQADVIGPDDPLDATYVLGADLAAWRDLTGGADPGQ